MNATTEKPMQVLYTAKTRTTGGREKGVARSSDGNLDLTLSPPGSVGKGVNPEQLFAAGWSACFEAAMGIAARKMRVALPDDVTIDAEVDLKMGREGAFLEARLNVSVPGVQRSLAQALIDEAHRTCPYSKAIRGNVDVSISLV